MSEMDGAPSNQCRINPACVSTTSITSACYIRSNIQQHSTVDELYTTARYSPELRYSNI